MLETIVNVLQSKQSPRQNKTQCNLTRKHDRLSIIMYPITYNTNYIFAQKSLQYEDDKGFLETNV